MLKLGINEHIILVVHKHWFVLFRTAITLLVLVIIPPVVLSVLPSLTAQFDAEAVAAISNFLLSLYFMVLLFFLFLFWMDYHLDMWIITNRRIVDVEQRGLFDREVSEIPIQKVQDVTIEVRGVIETFLKFGTIKLQTAGEREFLIENIPRLYEIKDAILASLREEKAPAPGEAVPEKMNP